MEGDTHPAADASSGGTDAGKEARFKRIAEAVRNGTYHVDTDALALKLIKEGLLDRDQK